MGFSGARLAVLAAMLVALATAGSAAAQENERGIDPNQGRQLVEAWCCRDKAAAIRLQLNAESYGIDFNDHYLRTNANGTRHGHSLRRPRTSWRRCKDGRLRARRHDRRSLHVGLVHR